MTRINQNELEEGLLVTGMNPNSAEARLIRKSVHSVTNHNGMVVCDCFGWGIAEAVPPVSRVTPISHYEKLIDEGYVVRFYRIKNLDRKRRVLASRFFFSELIGLPYPKKWKMALLALPIYNAFVDKTKWLPSIRLSWCSQLVKRAYEFSSKDCLLGYGGKRKAMFTPKTFENRIIEGLFEDVTDVILDRPDS